MSLAPGTRLGAYEVLALVGAEGVGGVYCAKDTKLHCEVATDVLRDLYALGADRLGRFKSKAEACLRGSLAEKSGEAR